MSMQLLLVVLSSSVWCFVDGGDSSGRCRVERIVGGGGGAAGEREEKEGGQGRERGFVAGLLLPCWFHSGGLYESHLQVWLIISRTGGGVIFDVFVGGLLTRVWPSQLDM